VFAAAGMIGAFGGSILGKMVDGQKLLALFALVMIVIALLMLKTRSRIGLPDVKISMSNMPAIVGLGLATGTLSGFFGIGGGFLIVPALVLLGGIAMKQAVGTSLLVIAMNCASGFAGYAGRVDIPWTFVLSFIAVAAIGILLGTSMARRVPQRALKQAFAVFLVVMGTFILVQNRRVFTAGNTSPAHPGAGR